MSEVLKSHGYLTAAVLGAFVLDARFGLNQGFDFYSGHFESTGGALVRPMPKERRGDRVVREALEWLEANDKQRFFLWIHLYDPHKP